MMLYKYSKRKALPHTGFPFEPVMQAQGLLLMSMVRLFQCNWGYCTSQHTLMTVLSRITLFVLISIATAEEDSRLDTLIDEVLGDGRKSRELYNKDTVNECRCVPYYQCPERTTDSDGMDLLDIRMKGDRTGNENAICNDYIETCCKHPNEGEIIIPTSRTTISRGCGIRNANGIAFKITGNENGEAQFGEFPWMIALLKKLIGEDGSSLLAYQCGGALIHSKVVLTAAHCVSRKLQNVVGLVARAGEWDTQRTNEIYPHQDRNIAQVLIPPAYNNRTMWNDFALLVLDKPFILYEHIGTVCLPESGVVHLSNECYASGWGKDKFGKHGQYQVILKKIKLPIVTKDQCIAALQQTRLGRQFRLHDSFLCAGGYGRDTCTGDGGSPLVCPIRGSPGTYEVTGLVSWGIGCGNETPGVYAGVAYARDWIDRMLGKLR